MEPYFNRILTEPDRVLAVELVVDIAQWADKGGYERPDGELFEGYGHHFFQGPFDAACFLLWELGAAVATNGNPLIIDVDYQNRALFNISPSYFKFLPEKHIRAALFKKPIECSKIFFWLIECWLKFAFA
jgi:hypothetical protein